MKTAVSPMKAASINGHRLAISAENGSQKAQSG